MSDIAFASATTLAQKIRDKEIGCLELLELYLARVEKYDGALNAIVVRDFERGRARAREADEALARGENWGPLHGVPMTIKESYDIAGLPSSWGVAELKDNIPTEDALSVQRLKAAGAVFFGKCNVPLLLSDWQSYNVNYGTTNNPWDVTRTPGGSSGGSAAALASGMTGLDAGSDIGASIRNPAHYCGVFGHKPTFGIVPMRGHGLPGSPTPPDISAIGPLARSADDLELATEIMAGPDTPDSIAWTLNLPESPKKNLSDFKVGVMLTDPNCVQDNMLTDQLQQTVDALGRLGVSIDDKARPDFDTTHAQEVYIKLLRAATGSRASPEVFAAHLQRAQAGAPDDIGYKALVDRAVTQYHREWLKVNDDRTILCQKWAAFFEEYDLLLCPTAASTAFPHDQVGDRADRTIPINNGRESTVDQLFWAGLSGVVFLPGTVAPAGLAKDGLPCGLQIVGGHLRDRTTIHFARLMERELGGFTPPPGYAD